MNLHERKLALVNRAKKRFPVIDRLDKGREFTIIGDDILMFWYNTPDDDSTHIEVEAESFCRYAEQRKAACHE